MRTIWWCVVHETGEGDEAMTSPCRLEKMRVVSADALVIQDEDRTEWIGRLARALFHTNPRPGGEFDDLSPDAKRVSYRRAEAILDRLQ